MKQQGCFIQKAPLHTPKAFSVLSLQVLDIKKGGNQDSTLDFQVQDFLRIFGKNKQCLVLRYLQ